MIEAKKKRRVLDPEIQAVIGLDRIMQEVPVEAMHRVLTWLLDKYGTKDKFTFETREMTCE